MPEVARSGMGKVLINFLRMLGDWEEVLWMLWNWVGRCVYVFSSIPTSECYVRDIDPESVILKMAHRWRSRLNSLDSPDLSTLESSLVRHCL